MMSADSIYYREERKHATDHFMALAAIAFIAFISSGQSNGELAEKSLLATFVLLMLSLFSLVHFYFISTYPRTLVNTRKNILILLDISVLTYFIILFGQTGLFFFPFYVWIVMRSGLSFGVSFFYSSLILSGLSWVVLFVYSSYWKIHTDIISTFAITTFLIPVFYLKFIIHVHEENFELSETLDEVAYDASYDELTGVPNRKQYKETMLNMIHHGEPFALLFIDMNKFKVINDTHGHHVGDEVLKEVARRLLEQMERGDFLARLGGDEFVIITRKTHVFMEQYIASLEKNVMGRHKVGKVYVPIELSIGVSFYPDDSRTAMLLSKYADSAMYIAKKTKDTYHAYYRDLSDEEKTQLS